MSSKTNLRPDANPSRIIGIQFSMLSPEEIRKNSVAEITKRDTYINNKPVIGGMFDPRMGVLEPGLICPTDGLTYINTPGYFGHIELGRPVFFIQHIKDIMKVCRCVCFKCSKLKIDKNQHKHALDMTSMDRWDYVSGIAADVKRCGDLTDDGCGCLQPDKIKLEGMANIIAVWSNVKFAKNVREKGEKITMKMTPEIVLKIFKRISDEDVHFMGFNPIWSRPDWMICQVLPVAPPAVRPSVKHDAQQRSEDDLTHIYSNIIKTNTDLVAKINDNAQPNVIEGLTTVLQYFVAMIVNNKVKGAMPMAQRSGRPLQCIMGRINSKNGRIRGNLMGKRVDFSARSVITGDPNLSIRQLGVPMKIAKNITKPIMVNDRNRDFLMKLVQNGPDKYPGAKILERKNGEQISLRYVDIASIRLENGDIVHRHMMNGDAVLFNRQPSLHRMSMMCHIVQVMKVGDTFRMNVGDTKPYNADFDGDEMNMHMPQNVIAETELRHLAAIPYQIISPAGNSPIIGIYQDSMLGSYRFTRKRMEFTPREAMNLLMMYPNVDTNALLEKGEKITNFDILSQIMPPITMKYTTDAYGDSDDYATSNHVLEVRAGKYIRGQMDKSVLGKSTKGIIHRAFNDFGNREASDFIDNLQNIITEYMKTSSFSVGISDLIADANTNTQIVQVINKQKSEVNTIINQLHMGVFENNTSASNQSEFEKRVNNVLNDAMNETGKISRKSLSKDNRFSIIVSSGSKGSLLNISQMISCLGQQNVDGKRIPYGFDSRTLPHFSKFDDSPNARGFVENSYISGLSAPELFFHAMGGRIGLIDTAVKTSQTGYIQRRLIKGLEDLKVEYDMTVRNSKGKVIQFMYGDDGFDTTRVENQVIPLVGMSIEDIYMHYDMLGVSDITNGLLSGLYTKGTITRLRKQKNEAAAMSKKHIDNMIADRNEIVEEMFKSRDENCVRIPVAFQSIIQNIQGNMGLNSNSMVDITPLEAYQLIEEYYHKIKQLFYVPPTKLFTIMYYYYLSPRDLLMVKRFHQKALVVLLETIMLKYKQAIVHPGEMVGVIAGQSIGEPTTQLTLNTFHLAGVASKSNVTRGVPRIEEILRLTKNPKNPSLTVFLKPVDERNQERANMMANMMEHTKLLDVVSSVEICFDPVDSQTYIREDDILMTQFLEFEKLVSECNETPEESVAAADTTSRSKWIIRMELDPEILLDKNITMDDVNFAIKNSIYGNDIRCAYSDFNSDKLIFRIRLNASVFKKGKQRGPESLDQSDEIYLLRTFQDNMLNNIVLRGINGIKNVLPRKIQNMVVKDDGKYVRKDTWVLDTTGSNFLDTLGVDYIDYRRTYSNDIKEVFDVLGIEAARQVVHNELVEVMEFSGVYINYHHTSLLCDRMTSNRNMVSIFRTGIIEDNIGPVAKATFEVHTEVLLDAARHADFDHMRGVSANVMCGQNGYYGTNAFQLVLDMSEMGKLEDEVAETKSITQIIDDMFEGIKPESELCPRRKIEIDNNISTIRREKMVHCDDDYNMGF
jgi:DNA-directed RNA polymerase II subunit RPB1